MDEFGVEMDQRPLPHRGHGRDRRLHHHHLALGEDLLSQPHRRAIVGVEQSGVGGRGGHARLQHHLPRGRGQGGLDVLDAPAELGRADRHTAGRQGGQVGLVEVPANQFGVVEHGREGFGLCQPGQELGGPGGVVPRRLDQHQVEPGVVGGRITPVDHAPVDPALGQRPDDQVELTVRVDRTAQCVLGRDQGDGGHGVHSTPAAAAVQRP